MRRFNMKASAFFMVTMLLAIPVQSQFVCGDANGSGTINVADVTYLVDYLFREGPEPVPFLAGDCNSDDLVNVVDLTYLVNYLFRGGPAPCATPTGYLVDYSACKSFQKNGESTPPDSDCVEYEYDGASVLSLKHVNTAFNCCPDTLKAQISIVNNLITIVESEAFDSLWGCPCLCLYDLDMQIINLPPGIYTIVVNQMYLQGDDETHEFTITLSSSPSSDSHCIYRDGYPWGYYQTPPVSYGECKTFQKATSTDSVSSDQDCIEYQYDGQSVLSIHHINAGFNCCPDELAAIINIEGNIITIEEVEYLDNGGCYCLCLFDLDYQITGLPLGEYTISVIEPYRDPGDEPLEFTVNLSSVPSSGIYCVDRSQYPWGF
jgi:hypothetical protein